MESAKGDREGLGQSGFREKGLGVRDEGCGVTQRVQVPNNKVLGSRLIVIAVQVLGKYMIIGYLDPLGHLIRWFQGRCQ